MMGAATEKEARLPRFSLVLGIESCCEVDDVSCLGTLEKCRRLARLAKPACSNAAAAANPVLEEPTPDGVRMPLQNLPLSSLPAPALHLQLTLYPSLLKPPL